MGAGGRTFSRWRDAGVDPVVGLYLAVVALAAIQVVLLGSVHRTLRGAVPYVAAAVVVLIIGRRGRDDSGERRGTDRATGWGTDRGAGRAMDRWISRGVGGIALAGALLGSWAIAQFVTALPHGLGATDGFYRVKTLVTSPVGDHNTLAGLLLVAVVAGIAMARRDRRFLGAAAVSCLGVVACLSRGAAIILVGVALASTVIASTRATRWTLATAAAATLAGVLLLAVVLGAAPPPGAVAPQGGIGASVMARADLALRGVEVALERPVIGAGLGSFVGLANDLASPNDHAHQLLAHAAAEGGIVLLAVVAALPVVLLLRAWRLPPSALRDTALLGGGGLVAHAQLEILGGRIGYEILLATLIALTGVGGRSASEGVSGEVPCEA